MHLQPTLHTTQHNSTNVPHRLTRILIVHRGHNLRTHSYTSKKHSLLAPTHEWHMALSQSITKQDPSVYSLFITQLISTCRYAEIKTFVTAVTSHSRSPIVTARASPITGETNVVGLSEVPHTSFPSPPTNRDTTLHNRPIPHLHHHAS